jgi:hypothetical protein
MTLDEPITEEAGENGVSPFPGEARTNTDRSGIRSRIGFNDA